MPYKADQPHLYEQYANQYYPNHEYSGLQYVMSDGPTPYAPLEAVVPQHVNRQQPIHQGHYIDQQPYPPNGIYPQVSIPEQFPPQQGHQQAQAVHNQASTSRQPAIQAEIPPNAARQSRTSPIDYQLLLLSLADEYMDTAHSIDMLAALNSGDAQPGEYYKLVSTALGCMETVLNRFRLQPLKEAQLRFRYARALYDETENDLEAETALSKGIDLCERNKLRDLKYSMQVLLSKVLYRSSPKAAIKAIDGIIEDVCAYKHIVWEYAFRYLRATLSLSMASHQDFVAAIHQLQKAAHLANRKGDQAVFAFAGITEALAHLQSSSSDSIEQAQRALATTRQVQLSQDFNVIPQIQVLVQFVDLCCSLQQFNPEQIGQKLSTMQHYMDQIVDDANWLDDGTIYLPLTSKSVQGIASHGGDIVQERNGKYFLTLSWLPKRDVYTVGYLLSAVATSHKNAGGDHKAELFLDEGLALIRSSFDSPKSTSQPLSASTERMTWRKILECQFLLEKAFLLCARSEWETARTVLNEIDRISSGLHDRLPRGFYCVARYLAGAVYQGSGELDKALAFFRSHDLALPPDCNKTSHNSIRRDIALLAAMNTILIIRSPSHPSHHLLSSILSTIDPYLSISSNKNLLACRSLLISNLPPSTHPLLTSESLSSTLLIKKHLSTALNIAKTIGNAQITAMTLAVMSARFFKGVVGEQAEKSARAGQNMAYKSKMKLWMSVSNGMLAETLERQGKREEAEKVQVQALRLAGQMPIAMQRFEGDQERLLQPPAAVVNKSRAKNVAEGDEEKDELA
jgi:Cohesin loading factor